MMMIVLKLFTTGAPRDKRVIFFIDDLNMPKLDTYGSQPPIELLRQYQDFGGFYDRDVLFWREIHVSKKFRPQNTTIRELNHCVFNHLH